jgi:hypothetical protein
MLHAGADERLIKITRNDRDLDGAVKEAEKHGHVIGTQAVARSKLKDREPLELVVHGKAEG